MRYREERRGLAHRRLLARMRFDQDAAQARAAMRRHAQAAAAAAGDLHAAGRAAAAGPYAGWRCRTYSRSVARGDATP